MKLILFDIDGTLILSGGAGMRGMARAFEQLFGVPDAFEGIQVSGRIDPLILNDALAAAGLSPTSEASRIRTFIELYASILREELATATRQRVLPGVRDLVTDLAQRPNVAIGLLTGNYTVAAEIKLGHFDLWSAFPWGAFGEDGTHRNDLLPVALARARQRGHALASARDVLVIGDTPHDVECAHSGGAVAVAVATGTADVAALRATGADIVLDDLTNAAAITDWLDA